MCLRRLLITIFLLKATLLLPSCMRASDFDAGPALSPEELYSVSSEIFDCKEPPASPTIVYWTEDGEVYHVDPACYRLLRAENVRYSSLPNAHRHGKTVACASCGGDE